MTTIYDNWEKMYDLVDDLSREMVGDQVMSLSHGVLNPADRLEFLHGVWPFEGYISNYLHRKGSEEDIVNAAKHIMERRRRRLGLELEVESTEV